MSTIRLQTAAMGELIVAEDNMITFAKGLLGFEGYSQFALIHNDDEAPFSCLQNIENAAVSFVVTDPFVFFPDYEWELPQEVQTELGIDNVSSVLVLSIVIVPTNPLHATINLMAPLVINRSTRRGMQFVLHDSTYGIRVPLLRPESVPTQGG